MMQKLRPGTIVSVTTQYRDPFINAPSQYREYTYTNVKVLLPELWFSDREFKIEGDSASMPWRVINMARVIRLVIGNKQQDVDTLREELVQTKTVEGSKGNQYIISFQGNTVLSCTCPQNTIRRMKCKHMSSVENELKVQQ